MKILVIGFQRSGTTLLRRIFQVHPQVRRMWHESFLLTRFSTREQVMNYIKGIKKINIDPEKENWGEKIPYYGATRNRVPAQDYCKRWNEYFKDESRVIHIVRHPYDVSFSVVNKAKHINEFNKPLRRYIKIMSRSVPQIMNLPNTITVKYEELLLNPDDTIPALYDFCGLKSTINFKKQLSKLSNRRYQKIDSSRAFAYKDKEVKTEVDCTDIFKILNQISGPRYEI